MTSQLLDSLRKYPLPGWDLDCDLEKFSQAAITAAVKRLLEEHDQFPVPWSREEQHVGFFVVKSDDRYLGFSGLPAPGEDEDNDGEEDEALPALGLSVEAFSGSESAADAIVGVCFS